MTEKRMAEQSLSLFTCGEHLRRNMKGIPGEKACSSCDHIDQILQWWSGLSRIEKRSPCGCRAYGKAKSR